MSYYVVLYYNNVVLCSIMSMSSRRNFHLPKSITRSLSMSIIIISWNTFDLIIYFRFNDLSSIYYPLPQSHHGPNPHVTIRLIYPPQTQPTLQYECLTLTFIVNISTIMLLITTTTTYSISYVLLLLVVALLICSYISVPTTCPLFVIYDLDHTMILSPHVTTRLAYPPQTQSTLPHESLSWLLQSVTAPSYCSSWR